MTRHAQANKSDFRTRLDVYCLPMPRVPHREEIEIKLRVQDLDAFRTRLKRLRAREITPRTFESNTLYDTPGQDLRRRGRLIRIRTEQGPANFGKRSANNATPAILTYKGPLPPSRNARKAGSQTNLPSQYKIRDEAEVQVAGPDELTRILGALGLHPAFRYEKFRTTYALPGVRRLKIELDETPIGTYLELEGTVPGIDRGARLLGYDRKDYLKDSYGALYLAACRRRGRKPGDMLFPPTKKMH